MYVRSSPLRLIELLRLLVELVHLAVRDGIVVERDGEVRIELLRALSYSVIAAAKSLLRKCRLPRFTCAPAESRICCARR